MATIDSGNYVSSQIDIASEKFTEHESVPEFLPPSTYQMRPGLPDTFRANKIKEIIQTVLVQTLQGKNYSSQEAGELSKQIADQVSNSVRDLNMRRYKHVVQVSIGQQLGSGCRYIAKCCWDAECDNQTSDVFTNASLFCICSVFGIYLY